MRLFLFEIVIMLVSRFQDFGEIWILAHAIRVPE